MTAVSKSSQVVLSRFRLFKYQITTGVVCIDESRECEEEEWRYRFNLVRELPSNIYKTDDVSRNPIGASKDLTESLRVLMIVSPWSLLIRDDALTLLGVQVESVEALVNCATQCQIARFQFLFCDFT